MHHSTPWFPLAVAAVLYALCVYAPLSRWVRDRRARRAAERRVQNMRRTPAPDLAPCIKAASAKHHAKP